MNATTIPLEILDSFDDEISLLENSIKNLYDEEKPLTILEAGCGQKWPLNLTEIKYEIIGVDLDEVALQFRVNNEKDLNEAIVADLHDFDLGGRKVDVIYNSFVLEHVEDAALILDKFNSLLKPGGLMILKLPDRNTVFGFVTRLTPFWVHVFYKKYMQGFKDAGKPGCAPYPTYYNKIVSREGIRDFCESREFSIDEEYGICGYLRNQDKRTTLVKIISMLISIFSFGKLPWKYNTLTYVLKKNNVVEQVSLKSSTRLKSKSAVN